MSTFPRSASSRESGERVAGSVTLIVTATLSQPADCTPSERLGHFAAVPQLDLDAKVAVSRFGSWHGFSRDFSLKPTGPTKRDPPKHAHTRTPH